MPGVRMHPSYSLPVVVTIPVVTREETEAQRSQVGGGGGGEADAAGLASEPRPMEDVPPLGGARGVSGTSKGQAATSCRWPPYLWFSPQRGGGGRILPSHWG